MNNLNKEMKIIEVRNLKKSYGDVKAINGIDFHVKEGELFAFLGLNGAGKSTTIDIISTILKPDSGEIFVDGFRLGKEDDKIRESIGIVFQDSVLDPLLTVKENLMTRGSFYGMKGNSLKRAILEAAEMANAYEILNRQYGKLSGGQRRRADIARALINKPKILFLDEPTTGLDPQTRKGIWEMIRKLRKESKMTVFLTTHYMEEAADSDYIIIMRSGDIIVSGIPHELKEKYSNTVLKIRPMNKDKILKLLSKEMTEFSEKEGAITVKLNKSIDSIDIIRQIDKKDVESIEVIKGTMDDVFLNVAGEEVEGVC